MIDQLTRNDRGVAFFVFGFLLACYLVTYSGVIQSSDGLSMFATAESIVRRGEVDSNQLLWMGLQQGSFGPDGDLYGRKGLGMVLLALPLVWFAHWWGQTGMAQAALFLNPILTAWTGALLYRLGCRLGWNRAAALFTALTFGLGTLAWPYTQEFFSDPVCGWGLFAAFYGLYSYRSHGQKTYLFLGGTAWAIAYLARTINLVTLPIYALALLAVISEQAMPFMGSVPLSSFARLFGYLRTLIVRYWRPIVVFTIPIFFAGLVSLWWNWLRYGSVWNTGYLESESFSADWLFGITGLLIGPSRGIIWYSPLLLLGIGGVAWFWRHERLSLAIITAFVLLYVLLYGKWYMWHGGFSWGPRFLVPTLPFLALLTGPVWQHLVMGRNRLAWIGVIGLAALSITVQWLGMLAPFGLVQDWLANVVSPLFAPETFTQIRFSPLFLQWQFLSGTHLVFAWWHNGVDWWALAMPLSGVLVGVILLTQEMSNLWQNLPTMGVRNWFYGGALTMIALAMLSYHPVLAANAEVEHLTDQIHHAEQRGDAILQLLPAESQRFADQYQGDLPVYGLTVQNPLDENNQAWLARLRQQYRRIWVVTDSAPPESSGWELELRTNDYLLTEAGSANGQGYRLALYSISHPEQLTESGLGVVFGDPTLAETGVNEENGWFRLRGYALTPIVRTNGAILVELRWESLRKVEYDYQVFVHLVDSAGNKQAQRDGQPVLWMRPTSTWHPGERIVDHYALPLPANLAPGGYTIAVGLYDPVSGQRLPVSIGPEKDTLSLGPIQVTK
ncbi:MAG: hypothetical protein U0175_33170 [Caldilineaceae bacterium]